MSRIKPYPIRMPDEFREYLEEKSEDALRSLNSELLFRLEFTVQLEKLLELRIDKAMDDIHYMKKASDETDKYKDLYIETQEKLDNLTKQLGEAFAMSGGNNSEIAIRKMKKAITYISTGLTELESLIPDSK